MLLTLALLAVGVALAARYGDFSMRVGDRIGKNPMSFCGSVEPAKSPDAS